jgi:putative redox protein
MTVHISIDYEGQLRCKSTHGPSKSSFITDAPADNHGKGEAFSPTDLVATALGACVMTTMGILAQRLNIDLAGMHAEVTKDMVSAPFRRIGKLTAKITIPAGKAVSISAVDREKLERAAHTCPVHKSLHPEVESIIELEWEKS